MTGRIRRGWAALAACAALLLIIGGCGKGSELDAIVKEAKARGARFEADIKDMTAVAQLTQESPMGTMDTEMKLFTRGKKYRTETTMPQMPGMPAGMAGGKMITIYDGKDAWVIRPMMGKTKAPRGEGENPLTQERDWWKFVSDKTRLAGREEISGRDCHVIDFGDDPKNPFSKMWLDSEELLTVQAEMSLPNDITVRVVLSDFRELEGEWKMPYRTEIFQNGERAGTMAFTSVEVNTGLSDDLFDAGKIDVKEVDFQQMMKQMPKGR